MTLSQALNNGHFELEPVQALRGRLRRQKETSPTFATEKVDFD
jgi:hypothetical protein